jgi:hypothetical protein
MRPWVEQWRDFKWGRIRVSNMLRVLYELGFMSRETYQDAHFSIVKSRR